MIDQTAIGVALITLIGVIITQYVTYQVQKADRESGIKDAHKAEEEKWKRLEDKLDVFDNKLDEHGKKLDKHNGFEGRIIALEVIAEWMQKEMNDKEK